jgi:hypothetical protein
VIIKQAIKYTIFLLVFCFATQASGQELKFDYNLLDNPTTDKRRFESYFRTVQTKRVRPRGQKAAALQNGYAKYKIVNPEAWTKLKDTRKATQIEVVYTKYPKDLQFWLTPYHELLANRLKALFEIDPDLNDASIKYIMVLQTACESEEDARKMWHGILIRHRPMTKKELAEKEAENAEGEQELVPGMPSGYSTVKRFLKSVGGMYDSVIYKVLDRNRQWKNVIMVSDWTGSNYQYAAQSIVWHMENFSESNIKYFSFFNDGNSLPEYEKKVGEAGGLYFAPAYKTRKVVRAFKTSMRKGLGGEIPENDVEAVLKSLEKYPDAEHAVLVADNSPFRDFELVDKVKAPIHVILQGAEWGINPQYINLAYLTGGSLHTLKNDYDAEFFAKGDTLISIDGYEFSLNKTHNLYQCNNRSICEDLEAIINKKEAEILAELKTKPGYRGMHKDKKTKGFGKFIHWLFGG